MRLLGTEAAMLGNGLRASAEYDQLSASVDVLHITRTAQLRITSTEKTDTSRFFQYFDVSHWMSEVKESLVVPSHNDLHSDPANPD